MTLPESEATRALAGDRAAQDQKQDDHDDTTPGPVIQARARLARTPRRCRASRPGHVTPTEWGLALLVELRHLADLDRTIGRELERRRRAGEPWASIEVDLRLGRGLLEAVLEYRARRRRRRVCA